MRTLLFLVGLAMVTTTWAEKKSPEQEAQEAQSFAEQLKGEAEFLQKLFEESETPMPPFMKRYIDMTEQEAELVARSAEYWADNQPRRAQMIRERAQDICSRRGKMSEQVHSLAKKTKQDLMNKQKTTEGEEDPACNDKLAQGDKELPPKEHPKKDGDKAGTLPPDTAKTKPEEQKPTEAQTPEAPEDLSDVEVRLREIQEQEAALARERRELIDQVRESSAE